MRFASCSWARSSSGWRSYGTTWHATAASVRPPRWRSWRDIGEAIYLTIAVVELTLILLAAPAATAGAVCLDKARGTLDHMLATDLSNAEIVLGKLGVRLIPVLGLIACVLPVVAMSSLLGGIDPTALLGSFLVAIGCAVVGCALAITLSVWARKTHEVVMMTYMLIIIWLIFPGLVAIAMHNLGTTRPPFLAAPVFWQFVLDTNPYFLIFAPYTNPAKVDLTTFVTFLGACLAASGGLLGLATVRVPPGRVRQAGRPAAGPRLRWLPRLRRPAWIPRLPGPSLDDNPVAWREWHRMRPSWMMRIAWGLYAALGVLWLLLSLRRSHIAEGDRRGAWDDERVPGRPGVAAALRQRRDQPGGRAGARQPRYPALDPDVDAAILAGKWRGTFRQVGPVLFWPVVLGGLLLVHSGNLFSYLLLIGSILAYGAVITSLGLAMATRVSRLGRAVALCVSAVCRLLDRLADPGPHAGPDRAARALPGHGESGHRRLHGDGPGRAR